MNMLARIVAYLRSMRRAIDRQLPRAEKRGAIGRVAASRGIAGVANKSQIDSGRQ